MQNKKSQWIFLGTTGVGLVIYSIFFLVPWQYQIYELQQELNRKKTDIAQEVNLENEYLSLKQEQQCLIDYLEPWNATAAQQNPSGAFFGEISEIAQRVGTQNLSLDPLDEKQFKTSRGIPLQLGVRGNYLQIQKLIYEMERLPHEIWIENMTLSPLANEGSVLRCELTLEFFAASGVNSD